MFTDSIFVDYGDIKTLKEKIINNRLAKNNKENYKYSYKIMAQKYYEIYLEGKYNDIKKY